MDSRKISWIGGLALFLGLMACGTGENQEGSSSGKSELPKVIEVPSFSSDSAYRYVAEQVAFGPRVPGTEAQLKARDYFVQELKRHGAETIVQAFSATRHDGEPLKGYNVIGKFYPEAKDRILLCAHWDSRYTADEEDPDAQVPGANDGASGVGILLEIARLLGAQQPGCGVDIVLFDLEDQGISDGNQVNSWGMGAQYWANQPHMPAFRFRMGILLDMVGAKNATFFKEGFSMRYAESWVDRIWILADQMGYGNYFLNEVGGGVTDDHYFINTIAGIPTLDIIHKERGSETGFFEHWHTTADDLDAIDRQTLKAVGRVVTKSVYQIAADFPQ